MARSFRTRHKLNTVRMLWDRSGKSWSDLGVPGQPAWLVLSRTGEIVNTGLGGIPYADVLADL